MCFLRKVYDVEFYGWNFLFSFSIYGLVISSDKKKKLKFLGTITPLGGLLLVYGWCLLFHNVLYI